jgi:hypothetical protein
MSLPSTDPRATSDAPLPTLGTSAVVELGALVALVTGAFINGAPYDVPLAEGATWASSRDAPLFVVGDVAGWETEGDDGDGVHAMPTTSTVMTTLHVLIVRSARGCARARFANPSVSRWPLPMSTEADSVAGHENDPRRNCGARTLLRRV